MSKTLSYEALIQGGAEIRTKLLIPRLASDPTTPTEGMIWLNTTTDQIKFHNGASTQVVGTASGAIDSEQVQDIVGDMITDTATVNVTYDDAAGTLAWAVLDSPTVGGQTPAQLQSSITAAIVDSAPGTLDTLNELAAALGDDPDFSTTITDMINARAKSFSTGLTGGATSEVVTHNLNTRDVHVTVYADSTNYQEEDYIVEHTTVNTVTIRSEGGNIPAGRRVVVTA